jgi:hypothetical protein
MAQLYPQALDSLFVASYDSQGYGGNVRSGHHTGCLPSFNYIRSILYDKDRIENKSSSYSIVAYVFIATRTF